ncbi:MAG: hypothetical protein JKY61_12875 [Planctomycetes bacterium]|nr:hypothetical protein [Planctomycetota bacterium]
MLSNVLASAEVRLQPGREQTISLSLQGQNLRRELVPCQARVFIHPANGEPDGRMFLRPVGIPGQGGLNYGASTWEPIEGQPGWYLADLGPLRAGEYLMSYFAFEPVHKNSAVLMDTLQVPEQGTDEWVIEIPKLLSVRVVAQWKNSAEPLVLSGVQWGLPGKERWLKHRLTSTSWLRARLGDEQILTLPVNNLLITPIADNVLAEPIMTSIRPGTTKVVLSVEPSMYAALKFEGRNLPEDLEAFVRQYVSIDCFSTGGGGGVYDYRWIEQPRRGRLFMVRFKRKETFEICVDPSSGWAIQAKSKRFTSHRSHKAQRVQSMKTIRVLLKERRR